MDEIDWDAEEDEDAIILQQQPFETTMQIGNFRDYLNQLNTRFTARRSDIIINSTLSITLTPQDDGFEPVSFATIEHSEINKYVRLRNVYRAFAVSSNTL